MYRLKPEYIGIFTEREEEVLECLAADMLPLEISEELRINRNTTSAHVSRIREKLYIKLYTKHPAVCIAARNCFSGPA